MVDREYEEILQGTKLYSTLPAHMYVVAGHAYARTDISVLVILKLLQNLHDSALPPLETQASAAKALLIGNLAAAKAVLSNAKELQRANSERTDNFNIQIQTEFAMEEEEGELEAPFPLEKRRSIIMRRKTIDEVEEIKGAADGKVVCQRESEDCPMCEICRDPNLTVDFALDCHIFHGKCLSAEIQKQIRNAQFPIMCPVYQCPVELLPSDVKACLNQEWITKYENLEIQSFLRNQGFDIGNCPLCKSSFEVTRGDSRVSCPTCSQFVCLKCNVKYHDGVNCKEFESIRCKRAKSEIRPDDKF